MRLEISRDAEAADHALHMWAPFTLRVDGSYDYLAGGPWTRFWRRFFTALIHGLFRPIFFVFFGLRVRGIGDDAPGGEILVANHLHSLDCVMLACALPKRRFSFLSLKSNLEIPVIGPFVRLMGALPLPETPSAAVHLSRAVKTLLGRGAGLQIYPEGSLQPFCSKLRPFKNGAFLYAVDNSVPVRPCVFRLRRRTGWRRLTGRRPLFELVLLPPLMPPQDLPRRAAAAEMAARVRAAMEQVLATGVLPAPAEMTDQERSA